jgi:hypothetical protein
VKHDGEQFRNCKYDFQYIRTNWNKVAIAVHHGRQMVMQYRVECHSRSAPRLIQRRSRSRTRSNARRHSCEQKRCIGERRVFMNLS